ncbi:FAD-dependent oxidoreductase [Vibrio sp. Of7-15]|uniref:FAD-dependent oxidoreductase n=1 Tax=Vibrio sp. Of7-15 TaxID=2724879 RepID=UPI001EF21F1A|nr:FAD-dependent oxidoreductase [Vibrio sp. Of7-15]MCG7495277.1 FAD-dependent oxidoreductase [Vibrio sp. Of7-15]
MERRNVIKLCALLGLSSQSAFAFTSAFKSKERAKYQGEVIILGAGAAGLSAGYLLHQLGTPFRILESASSYSGRMKHTTEFADFPISRGGEWLHVTPNVLTQAVNNPDVDVNVTLKDYESTDTSGYFDGETLTIEKLGYFGTSNDKKFVGSSWLHFFETYIIPTVQPYISFNTQVSHLNYSGKRILLEDAKERLYQADKVIVTVPLQTLKKQRPRLFPTTSQ